MPEFLLLMHGDSPASVSDKDWDVYLAALAGRGVLRGGSAIGEGICMKRTGSAPPATSHLVGYVRIEARDLTHARELVAGNPVYEAGGTVEFRALPCSG